MMTRLFLILICSVFFIAGFAQAGEKKSAPVKDTQALKQFKLLANLKGDWVLSPVGVQEGKATKHKMVAPLMGTNRTAMSFKVIGKGTTLQEALVPGTKKEMATMYHCDDAANCQKVVSKHFCVKKNQPEYLASTITSTKMTFDCDMNTDLCKSNKNHVHKIEHELKGDHLKTTYTTFIGGKFKKNSIYHFDRKGS